MHDLLTEFESQKNVRAGGYTLLICMLLGLLFFLIKFSTPVMPAPVLDEGIEVNLGSSDAGSGTDQPLEPGRPAPEVKQQYTPPKPAVVEHTAMKEVETDDNKNEDQPVIKKPVVAKPEATKITEKEIVTNKPVKAVEPVVIPTPLPPKPKAVMKGGSGNATGGNDADTYKKGGSEGIAGGKGDQGKTGGDPNSKNYEGNGGSEKSGVSVLRGLTNRHIVTFPSFQDDFNENAKVAVDITIDETGKVTSAAFAPRGSTTGSSALKAIAERKAMQLKFNAGDEESKGTIIFNFRLKN